MRWMMAAAWRQVTLLGLCMIAAAPVHAVEEEAHVLILNGLDPYLPAYIVIDGAMRASLANERTRRVVVFSESLDAQRFPLQTLEPEFPALLAKRYGGLRIDVVVVVSQVALEFFKRHSELWPGARLVYVGFPGEAIGPPALPTNATGVVAHVDVEGTIDLALRLQPDAHRIVVVSGAGDGDQRAERLARQVLSMRGETRTVEYLSGLPLSELVARVAAEPAQTIVLYLAEFRDRDGRPYAPRDVLRAISDRSVAPVYGAIDTYMGFGVAAGSMESFEVKGRLIGEQVRAALAGGPSDPSRALLEAPSRCVADARLMQRWSLSERRLPTGCEIRFANVPIWRRYWWQIALTLAIIVGQTALILAMLAERRRRRTAESEARKRFSEMTHMNRRVAMGELSASIAHELNQPLGAILNNTGAAEVLIKANPPRLQEVAEILADIKRDDRRASDIIARIRNMLRKADSEVGGTDLNDAIGETMALLAEEASAKGVSFKTELATELPKVRAHRIELQQVVMNLALNGIEAMHGQGVEKRELLICSARANDKEAKVSVADSGGGIPSEVLPRVFDPFVTSKATGMGLGLAISRTIVEAYGGWIRAENLPSGGALFQFTIPFAAGQHA